MPNSGNLAGFVFDFSGDNTEKQKLAQERKLPVIVFVDHADSDVPTLQFFYPNVETNLCLHGALAVVFLLMHQRRANHITVSNAVGTLLQAIKLDNEVVQIKVSEESVATYNPDKNVKTIAKFN